MSATQHPIIQGEIKNVGFQNNSVFTYTYELDKELLHVYDNLNHKSTSAINCIEEVLSVLKETLQPSKTGVSKIIEVIKNAIKPNSPFKKAIIYTEVSELTTNYTNRGKRLNICAYSPDQGDFTGWDDNELYQLYCDHQSQKSTV
ncbi:hypothetical protein ACR6EC_23520 [Bacillus subtilis]|uniref:hypothetical protein n=1 Tax=Bacillus subtilis group TaxID=653685 RepID=UPI001BA3F7BA|nr:hypothetical protein [Bacillus subtilis]CAF1845378.1 hypothetical protein NRS6131_03846 [Bacillus subtilis]CAI6279287.1 hypothetical protein NRS6131_10440 [Bacillus subtilis]